jgi:hypothetical protein
MFKAIDRRSEEEIVILDDRWRERIEQLRAWAGQDALVCQGCRQPVNVKAGNIRRWHFAHKHLRSCPYAHASPALLQARAVLYQWLAGKFGAEATVEKNLDSADVPRPVDCWVEHKGQRFAYWVLGAAMKRSRREALSAAFAWLKITVHWVFLSTLLQEGDAAGLVHLTTTERDFCFRSVYDEPAGWSLFPGTLHYLDAEQGMLTTYRGLHLFHEPQEHQGQKLCHPLAEMLVSPKTGEFVHPGEQERLEAHRREEAAQEKRRRESRAAGRAARRAPRRVRPVAQPPPAPLETRQPPVTAAPPPLPQETWPPPVVREASPPPMPAVEEVEPPPVSPLRKPVPCMYCGKVTDDWWYLDNSRNVCKCRACLREGKSR